MNYAAPILVDVEYVRGKHLVKRQNVVIGRMPVMLRSVKCVLADRTRGELAALQEWSATSTEHPSQIALPPSARVQQQLAHFACSSVFHVCSLFAARTILAVISS
jgi:DNA-directed RNA polymerase beta subunit